MTRRSSGFSTEDKWLIVLIPGKARTRRAGLFTRVMLFVLPPFAGDDINPDVDRAGASPLFSYRL
jgi:hypothetical protein